MDKLKILFVDDDESIIDAHRRKFRKMRDEWEQYFAEDGIEALKVMNDASIDVIVTDMRMPRMDGAELLCTVAEKHPGTVRIILSGHSDREMIMKALKYTHCYLPKPVSLEMLKMKIEDAMHSRQILGNPLLSRLINSLKKLPSIPEIYKQLIDEISNPDASISRIGDLIIRDPSMSAGILHCVNSSFFGLAKTVLDPKYAVSLLGMDIVKGIVLFVKLFDSYKKGIIPGYSSINELVDHSLAVANFSKIIALSETGDRTLADNCFNAGILHDIGRIVLMELREENFKISELINQNYSLYSAEQKVLGASHADIGAYLLKLWGLPENLIYTVAYHHNPSGAPGNHRSELLKYVHVANGLEAWGKNPDASDESSFDVGFLKAINMYESLDAWKYQYIEFTKGDELK